MDGLVEDGSFDDNVGFSSSHDGADPRDPVGHSTDDRKGAVNAILCFLLIHTLVF